MLPISTESGPVKLTARPGLFYWALFLTSIAVIVALIMALTARAQQAALSSQLPSATSSEAAPPKQNQSTKPEQAQEQKAAVAADAKPMTPEEARQAQIVADTNKLYELAQELQAEVAKSNKNTLSLAVVKKAAEVEKLAKSLKERMKPE